MLFMNQWEIEEHAQRYRTHPVLGPATQFLREFMQEVNEHSDGWPYWSNPVHASAQLIKLIQDYNASLRSYQRSYVPPTMADVQKAIRPIKAFMTRRGYATGMKLPALQSVLPVERT